MPSDGFIPNVPKYRCVNAITVNFRMGLVKTIRKSRVQGPNGIPSLEFFKGPGLGKRRKNSVGLNQMSGMPKSDQKAQP